MAIRSKKIPAQIPQTTEIDSSPIEFGFLLDQSQSMRIYEHTLIDAFNALLVDQIAPNTFASVSTFNDVVNPLAVAKPINEVQKLSALNYYPEGDTALLDGIGQMINQVGRRFDQNRFRVLIAIFTDGFENASEFFTSNEIAEMIGARQKDGWQFVFITPRRGMNFGRQLGIPSENVVTFECSADGIRRILDKLSRTVRAYRLGDRNYTLQLQK
jgi:hypothetical protein